MKIIKTTDGYCLATDLDVICLELPIFLTEQEAANWLVRINGELIEIVTSIRFEQTDRDGGKSTTTSILSIPKPRIN